MTMPKIARTEVTVKIFLFFFELSNVALIGSGSGMAEAGVRGTWLRCSRSWSMAAIFASMASLSSLRSFVGNDSPGSRHELDRKVFKDSMGNASLLALVFISNIAFATASSVAFDGDIIGRGSMISEYTDLRDFNAIKASL